MGIHQPRSVFCPHFRCYPAFGPAIFVDLRAFILNFDSYVEVNDLQAKITVTDKVVGLDISMSNVVLVKICESFDKAPAKLDTTGDPATIQENLVADRAQLG